MRPFSIVFVLALFGISQSTFAATGNSVLTKQIIPNSYIVTFRPSGAANTSPILPITSATDGKERKSPPFGEHSTGQSREALAQSLNISGRVERIFESINAAHLHVDSAEAERLKFDPRVLRVAPDTIWRLTQATQNNPRWALDRLDQIAPPLNGTYVYGANGTGQTIYILDSGLSLNIPQVAAEFGSRATVFWDVNYQNGPVNSSYGQDCADHGTAVASIAAGNTHGVAKGANLIIAKMTDGCSDSSASSTWIMAWNWLATNAPKGTIVNKSSGPSYGGLLCGFGMIDVDVEAAMHAAFEKGIIMVAAAGNAPRVRIVVASIDQPRGRR